MLKSKGLVFFYFFISVLGLMICAFWNGYPILYADTSTYLNSAFEVETPVDRPIMYGLFIRLTSFNFLSLWTVIGFQVLLFVHEVYQLFKNLFRKEPGPVFFIGLVLLGGLSSLSWTASQLMPDIFTSILLLSLLNMIWSDKGRARYWHYFVFLISVACHLSHISFSLGLIVFLVLIRLLFRRTLGDLIPIKILLHAVLLTFLALLSMGKALSNSKHVFLAGAMAERGVLQAVLEDKCSGEQVPYQLCTYQEEIPSIGWQFVWEKDSPLYKIGGWKASKKELNQIIKQSLLEPKYLWLHVISTLSSTIKQLSTIKVGDGNGRFDHASLLSQRLKAYVPHEYASFVQSKQNLEGVESMSTYIRIHYIILLACLGVLMYRLSHFKGIDIKLQLIITTFVLSIIWNAFLAAAFANVIDRLGSKMIFLIPLVVLFTFFKEGPIEKGHTQKI